MNKTIIQRYGILEPRTPMSTPRKSVALRPVQLSAVPIHIITRTVVRTAKWWNDHINIKHLPWARVEIRYGWLWLCRPVRHSSRRLLRFEECHTCRRIAFSSLHIGAVRAMDYDAAFARARQGCRNTAAGVLVGGTLGAVGGASAAIVNGHSVPFYALKVGTNVGMLSCCFFGLNETFCFVRQRRDVWNPTCAGAISGFVCLAAYGGPRFGLLGSLIMSGAGYGGHHLSTAIDDAKETLIQVRKDHHEKQRIAANHEKQDRSRRLS